MENDERSIRKTPDLENEYDFSNSRRSSTSLSLVGVNDTPTDLREINVYDRVHDSPISPPVHPRCRSTTEYTTTERSHHSTTATPKFQCTRSQCPTRPAATKGFRTAECSPPRCNRSPPQCIPCAASKSPCATKSPCTTQSPCTTKCTTQSPCTTKCTTKSPRTTQSPCTTECTTQSPCTTKCTTKATTCPTRTTTCTPRSPTCATSPTCTTSSPTCTMRTTSRCTSRSPECTTRTTPTCTTTQCTPRTTTECTPSCSPGAQSVDSRGAQCPLDVCRDNRRNSLCCKEEQKLCPLELCKMRAGLGGSSGVASVSASSTSASASRSICSSPTSNNSTKRVPFPAKKVDDDCAGGVVRWTEKCSQRCKRPTWNSNRWNCDKPATRPCVECTGAHPPISRCAQDYDAHRFGTMDGKPMRKCDCCDKRYNAPMITNQVPTYQTLDRGPISSCGCDGYARGINHFRRPQVMPQNPFDNSSSAYFNRLHKGMPFSNQPPPPPPPPPSFNGMPQPPFNTTFNHPQPQNVSTVTTRDNSLNVLQETDNFSSPLKSCGSCQSDQNTLPDSPNQNVNMVTNGHMFNTMYLPHNPSSSNMNHTHNHNYLGYGQKYPHDLMKSKESNI